jgi:hypothetical protein
MSGKQNKKTELYYYPGLITMIHILNKIGII